MNESESKHKQDRNKAILSLDGLKYFITTIYWHHQTKVSKYHQISWSHLPYKELETDFFRDTIKTKSEFHDILCSYDYMLLNILKLFTILLNYRQKIYIILLFNLQWQKVVCLPSVLN